MANRESPKPGSGGAPAFNPGMLKLELFCRGLVLDKDLDLSEYNAAPISRIRAGLGSGLELVLPDDLYANVPVDEEFAGKSPYRLNMVDGIPCIMSNGNILSPVRFRQSPGWYDKKTRSGIPMTRIGQLQGTYLGIYPDRKCDFWQVGEGACSCRFCSVGLNLGKNEEETKSLDDIMEVVLSAKRESGITYVDFNTGHYAEGNYDEILEPYINAVKKETGLLVGVQTPPPADLKSLDRLRGMGVNRISFSFEFFGKESMKRFCPGKSAFYGREKYFEAIEYSVGRFNVTNGELIAGLEPLEDTYNAIEWLTGIGAIPTVCVFRPLRGTPLERHPPPEPSSLIPVFRFLYESCMKHGLPIGVAPNVKVSLVLLPEEGRYFLNNQNSFRFKRLRLSLKRTAFRTSFRINTMFKGI